MNAATVDIMNMNVFEGSSKTAAATIVAAVECTETATSGHHEVTYNETNQKVQFKHQQQHQQQQQLVGSQTKPIGFKQLKYRNNNKSLSTSSKSFVGVNKQQQALNIVVYLIITFITIHFAMNDTCLAIFKISPREWLQNCDKTGQVAFVDSQECLKTLQREQQRIRSQLSSYDRLEIGDIEWLLMILECDLKPMIKKFELFLPLYNGPKELSTPDQLNNKTIGLQLGADKLEVWRELLNIEGLVNYFYMEAMQILSRSDFCTYPTISRLGQLKHIVLGSKTLSYTYDLIAIKLHTNCLIKTLNKLPQVPYLVKDVVDTYLNGIDNTIRFKSNKPFGLVDHDEHIGGDFVFDANEAIAKNGPLKNVVQLSLSGFGVINSEKQFIDECKEFLIDFEERWQTMEMMSKMLSTDYNGIQRFNNYVIRLLISTKYADACSGLSSVS